MTADDSTSYLPYLSKLVDQQNNTYHYSIKKPINSDYSVLNEKIEMNSKPPKFKENGGIRITIITTQKVILRIVKEKYLLFILF